MLTILFLSVLRFLAMTLALPMLILYADVIGIAGGAIVVAFDPTVKISVHQYLDNLTQWINLKDVEVGLIKGFVFGMIISTIGCTFGLRTRGGSEGVATSTTAAVVWMLLQAQAHVLGDGERVQQGEIREIVATCLEQVDLAGTENKMPSELSGGMRKRVAVARALAVEPQLILYDEPTADLDPILTVQIGGLIKRIQERRGTTQVVVAHNLALASEIGTHIAVLRAGRIVDYQPAKTLAQSENTYTQEFIRAAHLNF